MNGLLYQFPLLLSVSINAFKLNYFANTIWNFKITRTYPNTYNISAFKTLNILEQAHNTGNTSAL